MVADGMLAAGDRVVAVNGRFGCSVPKWGRSLVSTEQTDTEGGGDGGGGGNRHALHDMVGEIARSLQVGVFVERLSVEQASLVGWLVGWLDGWMDRWMDGWMDGWMDVFFF